MGTTPIFGFPYPDPSDLVANYPALGQQLAEDVETEILASGKIVQIVAANYSTETSTTSASNQNTGLTATITPTSASNLILVMAHHASVGRAAGSANNNGLNMELQRVSTKIADGTGPILWTGGNLQLRGAGPSWAILDSPATTSATAYKTVFRTNSSGESVTVQQANSTSSIVLIEVKP